MKDRVPPQDLSAEQSVLGSMMISKDAVSICMDRLKPYYFYKDAHGYIYNSIISLCEKGDPVDIITVCAELQKMGHLTVAGDKTYIAEILNSVPSAANVDHYAAIIQEKALLRMLIDKSTEILEAAFDDTESVESILGNAQRNILELSRENIKTDLIKLESIVNTVWDNISDSYDNPDQILGIPTGYKDLDNLTSGFQKSDLIILAARPAMGKTALCLNFALNTAIKHKNTVAIFSCEMPKEQLALRMLSAEALVSMNRLKTAKIAEHEYRGLSQALGRLSEAPIYIDDTPGISPSSLKAKCRMLQMESEVSLIIVDYLQLMRSGARRNEGRFQEVSEITRELKGIAKELNTPIIALSQLSRDVEKRGGDVPKLSDLRESGEIEQTADLVMFIHREDYYEGVTDQYNPISPVKLVIAKHRNGPIGSINLVFRKDVSRFEMAASSAISNHTPIPEPI